MPAPHASDCGAGPRHRQGSRSLCVCRTARSCLSSLNPTCRGPCSATAWRRTSGETRRSQLTKVLAGPAEDDRGRTASPFQGADAAAGPVRAQSHVFLPCRAVVGRCWAEWSSAGEAGRCVLGPRSTPSRGKSRPLTLRPGKEGPQTCEQAEHDARRMRQCVVPLPRLDRAVCCCPAFHSFLSPHHHLLPLLLAPSRRPHEPTRPPTLN